MKKSKGITLIALIITIIVLLILAGVTISIMTGENGVLTRAQEAKSKTDRAKKEEQEQMDNVSWKLNNYIEFYDEAKKCNKPKLTVGMVPVNYNSAKKEWEECSEENWDWDYIAQESTTESGGTSKWANAMTEDGSLWVWIPRYAYKIKSGYHTNTAGEIDVVFLKGSTNEGVDGNSYSKSYDVDKATTDGYMSDFVVHPVFGNNTELGGWSADIPGFWVAKFEAGFAGEPGNPASAQDSTVKYTTDLDLDFIKEIDNIYGEVVPNETYMKYPVFKPGKFSYDHVSIGDCFGLSKNLKSKGNPYGFSENCCNTHLMKNSEWGAIAYLTYSKYGRNKTEICVNNWGPAKSNEAINAGEYYVTSENETTFGAHTGYSSGDTVSTRNTGNVSTTNYYNTNNGVLASTTGNVYGIYDLSGGAFEYVAGYADGLSGQDHYNHTVSDVVNKYGSYLLLESNLKHKSFFSFEKPNGDQENAYAKTNQYFGDALWETSNKGDTPHDSWNQDYSSYVLHVRSFLRRGGGFSEGTAAGIFAFVNTQGNVSFGNRF